MWFDALSPSARMESLHSRSESTHPETLDDIYLGVAAWPIALLCLHKHADAVAGNKNHMQLLSQSSTQSKCGTGMAGAVYGRGKGNGIKPATGERIS